MKITLAGNDTVITLGNITRRARSERIAPNLVVDLDEVGRALAVQIIGTGNTFDLTPSRRRRKAVDGPFAGLSAAASRTLIYAGIDDVDKLRATSRAALWKLPGVGKRTLAEIESWLSSSAR
jgi:hypothetical protein